MLSMSEIKIGKVLKINGEPFVVIKTDHHKMGRGGAVLKTKLKNLITAAVREETYQGADRVEEAQTETKKANYMYKDQANAFFMDNASFEQFELNLEDIGDKMVYLKDDTDVDVLYFDNRPVAISLPIKMDFKVVSAPPGIKGNSVGSVTKMVEIETGATITTPIFVNEGDMIRVNTESGEYVERV
jgi:elongation factor P